MRASGKAFAFGIEHESRRFGGEDRSSPNALIRPASRATFSRFTGEGFALHIRAFRHRQKDHRRGRAISQPCRTVGGCIDRRRQAHARRARRAGGRGARFNPQRRRRRPRPRQIARPAHAATGENDGSAETGSAAQTERRRIRRRPCPLLRRQPRCDLPSDGVRFGGGAGTTGFGSRATFSIGWATLASRSLTAIRSGVSPGY